MKKLSVFICALAISFASYATDVQLIVEKVDNHGLVDGNTYRVYAAMPNVQQSLHIVFGDAEHPLSIQCTAPLYQHPYGGYSTSLINETTLALAEQLLYDSWITIGYETATGNDLWDLGIDFGDFAAGGGLFCNNGGWFLLPTDDRCLSSNSLILIGQFTTTGIVSGVMNLQGWSAPQAVWQTYGATFSTENAHVFGCTDHSASNYNADATYNDNTCDYRSANTGEIAIATQAETKDFSDAQLLWEVFPNPLQGNLIHLQFKQQIELSEENATIDIYNMNGSLVATHTINAGSIVSGNKITIQQDLPAGSYKVVLGKNGNGESKTLVVIK
jgi:hypothetical protein